MPRGFSPPWHRQPADDETFYVLEGELTFWIDNQRQSHQARPGTLIFVPRGAPHSFRVESETARFLTISTPAGHERFFRAGGQPAKQRTPPPPDEPDMERLAAAGRKYGLEILGPPPVTVQQRSE